MRNNTVVFVIVGLILLTANFCCCPGLSELMATPTPTLIPTPIPVLSEGETLTVGDLAVAILEHELSGCVTNETGWEECPSEGAAYLWVHLLAENIGDNSALPVEVPDRVALVYQGEELWPEGFSLEGFGRSDWRPGELYPGIHGDGWEVFEVPAGVDLGQVTVSVMNWSYEREGFRAIWRLQ